MILAHAGAAYAMPLMLSVAAPCRHDAAAAAQVSEAAPLLSAARPRALPAAMAAARVSRRSSVMRQDDESPAVCLSMADEFACHAASALAVRGETDDGCEARQRQQSVIFDRGAEAAGAC